MIAALLDNYTIPKPVERFRTERDFVAQGAHWTTVRCDSIVVGLGPKSNGITQESRVLTKSPRHPEIMAILCLSKDVQDLRRRIENIIFGLYVRQQAFHRETWVWRLPSPCCSKKCVAHNLVQTTENTAAFVHGGPFANIAHGCNSLLATKMAMTFGDYVITEADLVPTSRCREVL
ncbi:MAG: formate--tetrahydrofolate ligase [Bacteroides graminisolvens]